VEASPRGTGPQGGSRPAPPKHLPPEEVVWQYVESRVGAVAVWGTAVAAGAVTHFATVQMGLETVAQEDCLEVLRLRIEDTVLAPGLIFFRYDGPPDLLHDVTAFSNVYGFVHVATDLPVVNDKDAALRAFEELPAGMSWAIPLSAWAHAFPALPSPFPAPGAPRPSFRVVCDRLGPHPFRSVSVCAAFGGTLQDTFGWPTNLNRPDLEVFLRLAFTTLVVGVRLSKGHTAASRVLTRKEDPARPHVLVSTTLQSCVAHCLARLGRITPGMVVCDPMAGTGSICLQGLAGWSRAVYLAGDIDTEAVSSAGINAKGRAVDVYHWDVRRLPLRTNAVDVLISDLPFGQRCGTHNQNLRLYKPALCEMARVCHAETGRAVLLTIEDRLTRECIAELSDYWTIASEDLVLMGHCCHCLVLHRTSKTPERGEVQRTPKRKARVAATR